MAKRGMPCLDRPGLATVMVSLWGRPRSRLHAAKTTLQPHVADTTTARSIVYTTRASIDYVYRDVKPAGLYLHVAAARRSRPPLVARVWTTGPASNDSARGRPVAA